MRRRTTREPWREKDYKRAREALTAREQEKKDCNREREERTAREQEKKAKRALRPTHPP